VITAEIQNRVTQRARQFDQAWKLQERMSNEVVGDLEGIAVKVSGEKIVVEPKESAFADSWLLNNRM
jgi:hypothetical protein